MESFSSSIQSFSKLDIEAEIKIGNFGLKKQIIVKGISWQTPFPGDEAQVHFTGRVADGARLECCWDAENPFKFKLGQCEVIKGLDEGVGTMKKGERAIFTIPPALAYGEAGSPPLVPPNSTLIFEIQMLSWSSIRDISGDGSLVKKITEEGEGWATPRDADEVSVKYQAKLENGMLISKSDEIVEFCLSDDHFFPPIRKAVKTMKRGEKAELYVKLSDDLLSQFPNGFICVDGEILNGAKLIIPLELVSWKSVVDINGDKKTLKKIIQVGEAFDRPNEGSLVKVVYIGRLKDGSIFQQKGCNEEPYEFIILEEQELDYLERAIMTMKKGEKANVTISEEYSSDLHVSGLVPANSALYYEVHLIDFIKEKPFWKMNTSEKIEACEKKKEEGNVLFKSGKLWRASKKYEKAAKYIEFDHSFPAHERGVSNALKLSCNLNNAACKLKLGDYPEASRLCTKVLKADPLNVKALYRRSQAYLKTCDFEKAEHDIEKALKIYPNKREFKLVYKELKDLQRKYTKCEAEIFSTMISKLGS